MRIGRRDKSDRKNKFLRLPKYTKRSAAAVFCGVVAFSPGAAPSNLQDYGKLPTIDPTGTVIQPGGTAVQCSPKDTLVKRRPDGKLIAQRKGQPPDIFEEPPASDGRLSPTPAEPTHAGGFCLSSFPSWDSPTVEGEWAQNSKGRRSDPVLLYLHGDLEEIRKAGYEAGWTEPLPIGTSATAEIADDLKAPPWKWKANIERTAAAQTMSTQYLRRSREPKPYTAKNRGAEQVMAFEKDNQLAIVSAGTRHHFRVFDTGRSNSEGQPVWAVSASYASAMRFHEKLVEKTATFPFVDVNPKFYERAHHVVDPDATKERDEILKTLLAANRVTSLLPRTLEFGKPAFNGLRVPDNLAIEVVINPHPGQRRDLLHPTAPAEAPPATAPPESELSGERIPAPAAFIRVAR